MIVTVLIWLAASTLGFQAATAAKARRSWYLALPVARRSSFPAL
jgi:hypothetical protein